MVPERTRHPFDARALVVQGEMWLTVDGATAAPAAGDRFDVAPGKPHAERYGPQGATYWVRAQRTTWPGCAARRHSCGRVPLDGGGII
jgi:hypothetical protein